MKYYTSENMTDMRFAGIYRAVLMPLTFALGLLYLGGAFVLERQSTEMADIAGAWLLAGYGALYIIRSVLVFIKLPQRTPLSWYLIMITTPFAVVLDLVMGLMIPIPFLALAAFRIWIMVYFSKRKPLFVYTENIFICPKCGNVARLDAVFPNTVCPVCGGFFAQTEYSPKQWDGMTEYARDCVVRDVRRKAPPEAVQENEEKTSPQG